jgi:nucleotide-binding universal stress UspA family protein
MSTDGSPTPHRHVACCVESESLSLPALREAARVAAPVSDRLSVVHVVESPARFTGGRTSRSRPPDQLQAELLADARTWLAPLAERWGGVPVTLEGDDPPVRLTDWAAAEGVDLIVVCPHRRGVSRLLGSFAAAVVRGAPCPVLLAETR